MANIYIVNSFSINMLPEGGTMVDFRPLSIERTKEFIKTYTDTTRMNPDTIVSAIGHADMAKIVSEEIGVSVEMNRISIKLSVERGKFSDALIVAQYSGPRLPEGATELPVGAEIKYWLVIPGMEYCTEPI